MRQPVEHKLHQTGQFDLEENVEYRVVNRFAVTNLLSVQNVFLSNDADLDEMHAEALSKGITEKEWEAICTKASRQIFTENKVGTFFLRQMRKIVKNPIENGIVKKGLLNYLSAYGLQLNGITGNFGLTRVIANQMVDAGRAGVASRINGAGGEAAFTWIAVGTGVTGASNADTTLGTETSTSGLARANSTATRVTTTVTNDTAQLVNTFTVTGTVAVTESGVLNASSAGTLLCRQTFSAINVANGDSLQITWKVKAA